MKKFLLKVVVAVLNFINLFFKPLSISPKVTIISRQSNEPTLDIEILEDMLKKMNIETKVLTKKLEKNILGMISYSFQIFRQMYHIATSKVVLLDGYCILVSILPKKKDQKVIQMWHALGAIKKFGWQNVDNPDGHSVEVAEIMKMHRNYDYIIAPGKITGEIFSEAFNTSYENVRFYGLPRIDYLRNSKYDQYLKIKEIYPQVEEKINVLYVPTFRKNVELNISKVIDKFDFEKCNFIIKKHFLDKTDYSELESLGVIVDSKFSSMDWLKICDKVITDYSAIAFEAVIANKEIYIYQPDKYNYENNVGLNIKLESEDISDYVFEEVDLLFDSIKEPYDLKKIANFRDKYIEIELDHCTEEFCKFIEKLLTY